MPARRPTAISAARRTRTAASHGNRSIWRRCCGPPCPERAHLTEVGRADRPGGLHGRRKGHALRPGRAGLVETLLPRLAVDLGRPLDRAGLLALFDPPAADLRLEIGFGAGEHLVAEAGRAPRCGFLGAEPFVNGMAAALSAIEKQRLCNIRLHGGDAAELLDWLPGGALSAVDILYPDPWRKRRHWKRRFVRADNLAALARVTRPAGVLRFATDWADYAAWALMEAARVPAWRWTAERAADWREPWPLWEATRYEAKARLAGRRPVYLTFVRRED